MKYAPREEQECPQCQIVFVPKGGKQVCCSRKCAREKEWIGRERQQFVKHPAGYIKIYVGKEYPHADSGGCVFYHRYLIEQKLGRYLSPRERVHHRNGRRDDNRIENLELWTLDHKDPPGVRVSDLFKDSSWVTGLLYC